MGLGKWIGGTLGFMLGGPLGILVGIVLGGTIENALTNSKDSNNNGYIPDTDSQQGQRNSFLFSLLVLASYIIKADGKVMHSEMQFVRQFLTNNFGEEAAKEGNDIMLKLFNEQDRVESSRSGAYKDTIRQCCNQIANNMDYSQRLQLLNFLALIAKSDGHVSPEEKQALYFVAEYLQMASGEADSMLNLQGSSLDDAYKVLEVSSDATDDEVRAAYRRLALKHHPDRVATLGEDIRLAAQKKFQQINEAKEKIYKARGM